MGTEIVGEAAYRGGSHRIKLHLDGKELTLRDGLKLTIPLKDVRNAVAADGELTVAWAKEKIVLKVGDKAARLADKILRPPSLFDKLGIKAGHVVSIVGLDDKTFLRDLKQRTEAVFEDKIEPNSDVIIFRATTKADLRRLKPLQKSIERDGAIWIIRTKSPKDSKTATERDVITAVRASGLVDVKICAFSDELSAMKAVIPKANR
jgi:Protein of unknown function (DUF3052)